MGSQSRYHRENGEEKRTARAAAEDRKVGERIRERQERALENERERLAGAVRNPAGDEFEEWMAQYNKRDLCGEYLVDGAVLTCDQAMVNDFVLPDGSRIVLEGKKRPGEEVRCRTVLHVKENGMDIRGRTYATVKDAVMDQNIHPFECNCKRGTDRAAEAEKIKADRKSVV